QPGFCVAARGCGVDVANIIGSTAEALEAGFPAKLALRLVMRNTEGAHRKGNGETVQVAHAIVLRQPRLRTHTHAGADGNAVKNSGNARAAAQVAGNDAQRGFADGSGPAVQVKILRAFGDVLASKQLRAAFG